MTKKSTPEQFEAMADFYGQADWEGGWQELVQHGVSKHTLDALPKDVRSAWKRLEAAYELAAVEADTFDHLLGEYGVEA